MNHVGYHYVEPAHSGDKHVSRFGVRVACHRFSCALESEPRAGSPAQSGPSKRQLRFAPQPHSKTLTRLSSTIATLP